MGKEFLTKPGETTTTSVENYASLSQIEGEVQDA
jgi:hypothetical protein